MPLPMMKPWRFPRRGSPAALRTQQIVAHESGAALTADPLGGSYYLEGLCKGMEQEILPTWRRWKRWVEPRRRSKKDTIRQRSLSPHTVTSRRSREGNGCGGGECLRRPKEPHASSTGPTRRPGNYRSIRLKRLRPSGTGAGCRFLLSGCRKRREREEIPSHPYLKRLKATPRSEKYAIRLRAVYGSIERHESGTDR